MTTTMQTFEAQPFYQVTDDVVVDKRVLEVAKKLNPPYDYSTFGTKKPASTGRSDRERVYPFTNADQRGDDGEAFSGFVAKADIHAADGRELTVIHSWYANNDTGIPARNRSWSAEFDDKTVADDFWENHWRPSFDGIDFVENAREYLDSHPDIPRRSVRIQELGLLRAWHSQKIGDHVLLEKFSTTSHELVQTPRNYEKDPSFEAGQVYIVPVKNNFGVVQKYVARTCLGSFVVPGGERLNYTLGWRTYPAVSFVQWSSGRLEGYSHPITPENGPVPLEPRALESAE